ncbi:MAG: DUF5916 domain-containing protein [Vicinamibacterales bacterium]
MHATIDETAALQCNTHPPVPSRPPVVARARTPLAAVLGMMLAGGPLIAEGLGARATPGTQATPGTRATPGTPVSTPTRRVRAERVPKGRILVDGRLDEVEWQQASPADGFLQQQPLEGRPATEPSDVRFLYDEDTLFIGGRLFDDEPDHLITNELKRDFNARDGDLFVVVLDTFADRRNSYGFQTNPMGAQRETQGSDDGRVNNQNWDTVWWVQTSTFERGWIVEMAIPFKSLRFLERDEQRWGLNLFRLIRRKNEMTLWSPVPRQFNQFKVSYAGVLEGLRGVAPGRDIRLKPYAKGQVGRNGPTTTRDGDAGVDVKVGVGAGLVVDGTYRTDFSQVEADEQQINLTRFSLFFPEKREFFLENQGTFQVGPLATNTANASVQQSGPPDLVPFFSRRIGLSDRGTPIPIVGGGRLSGKSGRSTIGLLDIQTERDPLAAPGSGPTADHGTNYAAARYAREFLSNSSAGAFYLGKETPGDANRVIGTDLRLNVRRRLGIDAMAMHSASDRGGEGTSWRMGVDYDTTRTRYQASRTSIGTHFRDDLGFIPRSGVDITNVALAQRFRPKAARLVREIRPELPYTRYDKDGFGIETETFTPSVFVDFADGSQLRATAGVNEEALTTPFRIRPDYAIAPGRYHFNDESVEIATSRARPVSLTGEWRTGEFWNGSRRGFSTGGRVRFSPRLATQWSFVRDHVVLPGIEFTSSRASLRVDGSFSTRMFLNAFLQYNAVTRETLANVRFNLIHHPLSDLFVVYNESRTSGAPTLGRRALVVKLTHLLTF